MSHEQNTLSDNIHRENLIRAYVAEYLADAGRTTISRHLNFQSGDLVNYENGTVLNGTRLPTQSPAENDTVSAGAPANRSAWATIKVWGQPQPSLPTGVIEPKLLEPTSKYEQSMEEMDILRSWNLTNPLDDKDIPIPSMVKPIVTAW